MPPVLTTSHHPFHAIIQVELKQPILQKLRADKINQNNPLSRSIVSLYLLSSLSKLEEGKPTANQSPLNLLHHHHHPPIYRTMDEEEDSENYYLLLPKPADWFTKLISFQADIIYNCLVCLSSPFFSLISMLFESYRRAKEAVDSAIHAAAKVPYRITHGSIVLLKKLLFGFLGAAYVCMVLTLIMVFAAVLGVGLVQLMVEEPVFIRERLYFDYTDVHPKAVFSFGGGGGWFEGFKMMSKKRGIPVGHTFYVSLVLLLPESDYNREIGVFQVTAELVSTNGNVVAKSSQPCMLRFRSLPIRLARTAIMGIPLLLGLSAETQQITIEILKHKEGYPRTEAIRVGLIPRAGTSYLPQLYEAEIIINSQLPWTKRLVHNWKWTFYVWASIYIYIFLVIITVCCFKWIIFRPVMVSFSGCSETDLKTEILKERQERGTEERDISKLFRKWKRNRSKSKGIFLREVLPEIVASSASSISISKEERSMAAKAGEEVGDSESVCL